MLEYIFLNSSFVKFVVVGLVGFLIDIVIFYLLFSQAKFVKPLATVISAEVAVISNFFMNNYWSFRHKQIRGSRLALVSKLTMFNLVSLGNIIIQWLGMLLSLKFIGDFNLLFPGGQINTAIVYKILIIAFIIIPYSYILYNKVIWKEK